jgi:hypothetical protein
MHYKGKDFLNLMEKPFNYFPRIVYTYWNHVCRGSIFCTKSSILRKLWYACFTSCSFGKITAERLYFRYIQPTLNSWNGLFGIFRSIRTEPPWRKFIRNTWNTFPNSFWQIYNEIDEKPNHSNTYFDGSTKSTEHFWNAFYFQIYKLFLKDCAPQQEKFK